MKLVARIHRSGEYNSCATDVFMINGIHAYVRDFGYKLDRNPDNATNTTWTVGCGDMRFTRKKYSDKILEKYGITEQDYKEVCDRLEELLAIGKCDDCL